MKKNKIEERLQIAVCTYIDFQYPDVIYTSDSSGINLTMGQAIVLKKQRSKRFKIPDLLIFHPNNKYKGLFIELKKSRSEIYLKNGDLSNKTHIQEQNKTLIKLEELGYKACFSCGFDETKIIIDNYFSDYDR